MIASWPGCPGLTVARLEFWSVGVVVFLANGDHFPVLLPGPAIAALHERYLRGQVETLEFPACPLLPPLVLH